MASRLVWSLMCIERFFLCNSVLHAGTPILMMGSVGEIVAAPTTQTKFIEDMDQSALAQHVRLASRFPPFLHSLTSHIQQSKFSNGLPNVGNTCYFNAVSQALLAIPSLRKAMSNLATSPTVCFQNHL